MKRDQRLIQSEAAIIDAGIRTFLSNPSAGMSEIAQASGVGRTTLYRHFDSREALIQAIARRCLDEIEIVLGPLSDLTGVAAIAATFEALIPLADRYRFLSSQWPDAEADPVVARGLTESRRETEALIEHAKAEGEIDPSLPSVWLTSFFEMTLYAAWALLESGDITQEEATRLSIRSFLEGCAA